MTSLNAFVYVDSEYLGSVVFTQERIKTALIGLKPLVNSHLLDENNVRGVSLKITDLLYLTFSQILDILPLIEIADMLFDLSNSSQMKVDDHKKQEKFINKHIYIYISFDVIE